jgi:hypothetical protein
MANLLLETFDSQFDSHGLGQRGDEGYAGGNKTPQFRLIWPRADAFPITFHVGNMGSNPVKDADRLKVFCDLRCSGCVRQPN